MQRQFQNISYFNQQQSPASELCVNSHVHKLYPQASKSVRKMLKNLVVAESQFNSKVVMTRNVARVAKQRTQGEEDHSNNSRELSPVVQYEIQSNMTRNNSHFLTKQNSSPWFENISMQQSQMTFGEREDSVTRFPEINRGDTRDNQSLQFYSQKSHISSHRSLHGSNSPPKIVLQEYGQTPTPQPESLSRLLKRKANLKSKSVKMLMQRKGRKLPQWMNSQSMLIGVQPGALIREGLVPIFRIKRQDL